MNTTTTKRQMTEIVIGNYQKPLRVVAIMPLQSLESSSQERGRVLGRRVQPCNVRPEVHIDGK